MSEFSELNVGDHISLLSGFPFSSNYFDQHEGTRLIRIRDLLDADGDKTYYRGLYDSRWLVKPGDILIGMDGDFNIVRWKGDVALLNQRILKVEAKPRGLIDKDYFFHWCRPYLTRVHNRTAATTVKHLSTKDISKAKALFPPKIQQAKIAEILSTVDAVMERTEALIAKYQQIKAGLMHDLFTRGVTPDGQLRPTRNEAPQLYKEDPRVGWIPKGWDAEPLQSFANPRSGSFVNGPFGSDLLTSELRDSGVPVIYVQDIKEDEYRRTSDAHVSEEKANELFVCNVRMGDVLVAKVGDPPGIAATYTSSERAIVTQDVIRIRPSENVVPQFLASLLNSTTGIRATGRIIIEGTRSRVSLTEYKRLIFPKPPHREQHSIAERLTAVQQSLKCAVVSLAKLRVQKQGLMQDLLTGRVPVRVTASVATRG